MSIPSKHSYKEKIGKPPGYLIHIGTQKMDQIRITVFDYDQNDLLEQEMPDVSKWPDFDSKPTVTWVNVDGLHDTEKIQEIGKHFNLHHLLLEDILNTGHRPKMEAYENCIFVTFKMLGFSKKRKKIVKEQVSVVLKGNSVLSFQEEPGDVFDPIRDRIRSAKGRVREKDAAYLVYLLIDVVVDNYFIITDHISEKIESLEERLLVFEGEDTILGDIQMLKKELISLKRTIFPLKEAINELRQELEAPALQYFNDLHDHTLHIAETIDIYREMTSGLKDMYLSQISNKMNAIMKVLTIIGSIFIPLTFVAGIYGMNFDVMPELRWQYGYFAALGVMFILALGMMGIFYWKKWL